MKMPRRSRMKLVREIYMKVTTEEKDYYLKEKAYASRWDGAINVDSITKATFDKAVSEDKRIEIVSFEKARLNIKNEIIEMQLGRTS